MLKIQSLARFECQPMMRVEAEQEEEEEAEEVQIFKSVNLSPAKPIGR